MPPSETEAPAGRDTEDSVRLGCHLDEEDAMPGMSYDGIFEPETDLERGQRVAQDRPPVLPPAQLRDEPSGYWGDAVSTAGVDSGE